MKHRAIGENHLYQKTYARGMKAAMSLKPKFPAETVFPFMEELDMVLIMTVEPGFGGQKLIPHTIEKVAAFRAYAKENRYDIDIEVDGGIGVDNLGLLTSAGANVIVAGSSIFKAEDASSAIAQMREQEMLYPCGK